MCEKCEESDEDNMNRKRRSLRLAQQLWYRATRTSAKKAEVRARKE
jgi:hypothetical protein